MKNSTKAKLGAGALAVATMFSACPQPTQETKIEYRVPELAPPETLSLNADGTLTIDLIYRKGTDVTKIRNCAASFVSYTTNTKAGMITRNGNYKIIVEYADSGIPEYDNIIATNGETVRIHVSRLSSNANISAAMLRVAFEAMLDLDPVAQAARDTLRWQLPKIIVYHYT